MDKNNKVKDMALDGVKGVDEEMLKDMEVGTEVEECGYAEDLAFVKGAFEEDGLSAPASLSAGSVRAQLSEEAGADGANERVTVAADSASERTVVATEKAAAREVIGTGAGAAGARTRRGNWRRSLIAAAACVALLVGMTPFLPKGLLGATPGNGDSTTDNSNLLSFASYEELDRHMETAFAEQNGGMRYTLKGEPIDYVEDADGLTTLTVEESAAAGDAKVSNADMGGQEGAVDANDPDHSSTYVQVEGIDEADIVKTDGKYIYFVSDMDNSVVIAEASGGKAKIVGRIQGNDADSYLYDMYVKGDLLVTIGGADFEAPAKNAVYFGYRDATQVTVYDIKDRKNPEIKWQYQQTGSILSSRLNGDMLYLVTNDSFSYYDKQYYPCVNTGGDWETLPIGDIRCFPETSVSAYTVIGAVDITADKASGKTVTDKSGEDKGGTRTMAILGGSHEVYCSGESLYVTTTIYPGYGPLLGSGAMVPEGASVPSGGDEDTTKTAVLKVDLTGGEPKLMNTATVYGIVNNQFSMDDQGGIFKIATTSYKNGTDVNNLYLLDEDMEIVGSLRNFAKDEHIEAVRYIKDKAYVITYEQTDPLFIIDLKDPKNPKIEGHVKISGFSTLLVPAGEDYLLGIGFSTESTEFGEATDGVKLALFDIKDAADPKVADSIEYSGMNSQVQYDHKALLVGPKAAYYAIPYSRWRPALSESVEADETTATEGGYDNGILVFAVNDGKLQEKGELQSRGSVRRCIYIGDYIYGITEDDTIEGFEIP